MYTLKIMEMNNEILLEAETLAARLGHRETAYTTSTIPGLYLCGPGSSGVIVYVDGRGLMLIEDLEDLGARGLHIDDLRAAEWKRYENQLG